MHSISFARRCGRFLTVLTSFMIFAWLPLTGCAPQSARTTSETVSPSVPMPASPAAPPITTYQVAVVGDGTRAKVIEDIASEFHGRVQTDGDRLTTEVRHLDSVFRCASTKRHDIAAVADALSNSDFALFAIDSPDGAMPIHEKHSVLARESGIRRVGFALARSHLFEDQELLVLIAMEMREKLSRHWIDGDEAPCVADIPNAASIKDLHAVNSYRHLFESLISSAEQSENITSRQFLVMLSSPTESEQRRMRSEAKTIESGAAVACVQGKTTQVNFDLVFREPIQPGNREVVRVVFPEEMTFRKGELLVLVEGDRLTGVGRIVSRSGRSTK